MKLLRFLPFISMVAAGMLHATDKFTVSVSHSLDMARPAEVIALPWSEVVSRLPGVEIDHFVVRDANGKIVPAQVTNFQPEDKKGHVDDLIFQHDFATGERRTMFTVERTEATTAPFPVLTFGRYAPDRFDDFVWENDRIAHRMYGPALDSAEPTKWGSGQLRSSGIDVWSKRVRYPIVNRWLLKGHDNYHKDTGEGIDMYDVGTSRGCGGLGVWTGGKLYNSGNYKTWKVLANGPIRTVFELTYETWDADGLKVNEVKRITSDAGCNLDRIESTFSVVGEIKELTVGIGLGKQGKASKTDVTRCQDGWMSLWQQYPPALSHFAQLGTAVVLSPGGFAGEAEDQENYLMLAKVAPGQTLRYFAGAGWTKSGDFKSQADWTSYVDAFAKRLKSPLVISIEPIAAK